MSDSLSSASENGRSDTCDTLYYDGQCPLCAAEIEALRETRGDGLQLVDIHDPDANTSNTETSESECGLSPAATAVTGRNGPSRDELLRTLHLRRADGSWLRGADANVAAWEGTRRGKLLSVLRWPLIRHLVDLGYALWARWRYRRLYGSQYRDDLHAPRS